MIPLPFLCPPPPPSLPFSESHEESTWFGPTATREIVRNYFFRRYAPSALSRVGLKLVNDDIAFWRGPGNAREHEGRVRMGKRAITGGNFTARSGLKVFDVIGCWTSISSLRRIAAVNRHSVAATSITSSIELRATKVSRIITKLYRKSDRLRVPRHGIRCKNICTCSMAKFYFWFFYVSHAHTDTHTARINMGWIVTDFYIFRVVSQFSWINYVSTNSYIASV